jgi:hypothetical protein
VDFYMAAVRRGQSEDCCLFVMCHHDNTSIPTQPSPCCQKAGTSFYLNRRTSKSQIGRPLLFGCPCLSVASGKRPRDVEAAVSLSELGLKLLFSQSHKHPSRSLPLPYTRVSEYSSLHHHLVKHIHIVPSLTLVYGLCFR